MQKPLCSIDIVNKSGQLTTKVQRDNGISVEIEDLVNLLEIIYEDILMEIDEDYW